MHSVGVAVSRGQEGVLHALRCEHAFSHAASRPDRTIRPLQVLHMDRNNYYGGESTSFNLTQVRSHMPKRLLGA